MYFVSAYLVSIVALKEHLKISSTKISDYVQGKQEKSSKLHTNIFVPKGIFPSLPLINLSCTYVLLCEVITFNHEPISYILASLYLCHSKFYSYYLDKIQFFITYPIPQGITLSQNL